MISCLAGLRAHCARLRMPADTCLTWPAGLSIPHLDHHSQSVQTPGRAALLAFLHRHLKPALPPGHPVCVCGGSAHLLLPPQGLSGYRAAQGCSWPREGAVTGAIPARTAEPCCHHLCAHSGSRITPENSHSPNRVHTGVGRHSAVLRHALSAPGWLRAQGCREALVVLTLACFCLQFVKYLTGRERDSSLTSGSLPSVHNG